MSTRAWFLMVAGFAAGAAVTVAAGFGGHAAHADKSGCAQWQTSAAPAVDIHPLDKAPEYGAPIVNNAPPGWEPFGVGASGLIYYRRCAP